MRTARAAVRAAGSQESTMRAAQIVHQQSPAAAGLARRPPGHTWRSALCSFMLMLTAGALPLAPLPAEARGTTPGVPDALEEFNAGFRGLYHARTRQVLEQLPLVLVVQNHTLTTVRGEQRRLYPIPLQRYNEARAVVHAVLGFHGLM